MSQIELRRESRGAFALPELLPANQASSVSRSVEHGPTGKRSLVPFRSVPYRHKAARQLEFRLQTAIIDRALHIGRCMLYASSAIGA